MTEFIQVSTTVNSKEGADKIARKAPGRETCQLRSSVGPYPQQLLVERKDRASEILAIPDLRGNIDYLNWIRTETARKPESKKTRKGTRL